MAPIKSDMIITKGDDEFPSYRRHILWIVGVTVFGFLTVNAFAFYLGAHSSDYQWVLPSLQITILAMVSIFALAGMWLYVAKIATEYIAGLKKNDPYPRKTLPQIGAEAGKSLSDAITLKRVFTMVPFLLISTLSFLTLSIAKSLIVHSGGYHFDQIFSEWDFVLHGDHYPQDLLAPLVESLGLIKILNFCYYFWFGVLMMCIWCAAYLKQDKRLQIQFWWSLVIIVLVLGVFMAHGLASVGPIYFADFYKDRVQPYEDYLTHLHHIDQTQVQLQSFQVSDLLLTFAHDRTIVDLNGISAMPSLHVALACLFFLYLRKFNKILGYVAFLFLALIQMGSVYFAWHYAIDGYVGIAGATLIWIGIGYALRGRAKSSV